MVNTVLFLNETGKNRLDFLVIYFCVAIHKFKNIYSRINFLREYVCGNLYLRELIFADRWKNRRN